MANEVTLRSGFTTGACAAAAAKAAYCGKVLPVIFPDGTGKIIPVKISGNSASVIKDAGDDPDVTDKALISVEIEKSHQVETEDYCETVKGGKIILCGGEGVGLATRPGLDIPPGKWAINPAPRKMIVENLIDAGFNGASIRVTITVANGKEIALKTLNPTLGIVGGISILGTSGIVVPYSNAAYIHTIDLRIRNAVAEGAKVLAFSTGSRTGKAILRDYAELKEKNIIRIADFIGQALESAQKAGVKKMVIACMPGKLYKYACGYKNTHAHKVKLVPELALELLRNQSPEVLGKISKCDTVGEMSSHLGKSEFENFITELAIMAIDQLKRIAPKLDLILMIYLSDGSLFLTQTEEKK